MTQAYQHTIVLNIVCNCCNRQVHQWGNEQLLTATLGNLHVLHFSTPSQDLQTTFKKLLISGYENTWLNAKNYKH